MEIPDVVSVRKFKEFNAAQKEEVYNTLLDLVEAIAAIPKKSLRKTLELTLAALEYKGDQVKRFRQRLEQKDDEENSMDSQNSRLLDENEKLKRMLEKLEDEKHELKSKNKELKDEIVHLQKVGNAAETSDKDSSDPLSELDKQEELLRNINTKNKHIKRLLKEIEALQIQNIEQSKTIINNERELQQLKAKELQMSADITLVDSERKALKQTVSELRMEQTRLEGNVTYLEDERDKSERELKGFIEKLEQKAKSWKTLLDQKESELKTLRARLAKEGDLVLSTSESATKTETGQKDEDAELIAETTKMMHAIESRDKLIEQLESKLKTMAEEMISSTKVMNKLSAEQEDQRNPQKPRACCKLMEASLQAANERCQELSEMLERAEEDNVLKAKQALEAITALNAYQSGEDGLVKALRKCYSLEQKLSSRDKQVQALIMELNSMHEIAQENRILRKRLQIPDDVVISVKNLAAKERQKDKIIDRLTLKLHASEEMRLQLKLEKSDLRKELMQLQKEMQKPKDTSIPATTSSGSSEIGEVEDSLPFPTQEKVVFTNVCENCKDKFNQKFPEDDNSNSSELEIKYQEVLQENETLRLGMHEILEKLREYDDCSDHITIDTTMLYGLLEALQRRTPNGTPEHLQKELQSLKQRERALRELLQQGTLPPLPPQETDTDELESVGEIREGGEQRRLEEESILQLPDFVDSMTRPTTPNRTLNLSTIPVITEEGGKISQRELEQRTKELEIYRKYYEELKIHMTASDVELTRQCAETVDKSRQLECELGSTKSSYAYMREDFDKYLAQAKRTELRYMQQVADLSQQLQQANQQIESLEKEQAMRAQHAAYTTEEYKELVREKVSVQAQLAHLVAQALKGELEPELKINDICMDYSVINDELEFNYITAEEWERLNAEWKVATGKHEEMQRKTVQLEGLLEIAQEQIKSQQNLLNEITDNHINLRHLVADLQSTNDQKFVLAKMQRDLDGAKLEWLNMQTEKDELKRQKDALQVQLNAAQTQIGQLKKDFQRELQNRNIKIKFLEKALYTLKDKYAKFTPLVFLTNFVFAYKRFIDKTRQLPAPDTAVDLTAKIDDIVKSQLETKGETIDEAQTLIKQIKTETQCKLLEEQLQTLTKRCASLEQELHEQRLRFANETEHWQTIDALFGTEKDTKAETQTEKVETEQTIMKENLRTQDAGTNTETRPIPTTRKVSTASSKMPIEMVDKNTSPIGTPIRKCGSEERHTQTDVTATEDKSEDHVSTEELTELPKAGPRTEVLETKDEKQISNVLTQTSPKHMPSQAVQTHALEEIAQLDRTRKPDVENTEARIQQTSEHEQLLNQSQEELLRSNEKIKELQQLLEETSASSKREAQNDAAVKTDMQTQQGGVIEKTILSFHTLLTEKDKSISKYQDLLQSEREQSQTASTKLQAELLQLKNTIATLHLDVKTKDMEILELKTQLETVSVRRNSHEKLDLAAGAVGAEDESGDNSINELTDEKIEEMFEQDQVSVEKSPVAVVENEEKQDTEALKEVPTLLKQLKDLRQNMEKKEEELTLLREKVKIHQERQQVAEQSINPEIEQLRLLLEDKDKHINELIETLNNFHDDQQRYIANSSNDSADRISKLAADLTRTEATNKIYQTQVDALRRQLTSLTQREKQARELSQSLRTQLIKRPVVSIKTELNARVKQENLQKRIHQLELELEETRAQVQRQQVIIDTKRARSASEVALWEKQKRWQQSAEKLKVKLEETENTLEKTRSLLQTARNAIARLEKEKQILEARCGRAVNGAGAPHIKCCRTPSCPNLQHCSTGGKYTPSESPETCTGPSSECSSPGHSASVIYGGRSLAHNATCYAAATAAATQGAHVDLIEALKARIEMQQRKIMTMELEGKGMNTLTTELEKLQERYSAIEAQNLRLESKNLQLQLDNDVLRQGDGTERLQKRIKHLEDYIIALKEEMAQADARRTLCKCSGLKVQTHLGQSAEQTILSLRGLVEKLKAENKYLKDGRKSTEPRTPTTSPLPNELSRLQQMYADSVDKIKALQLELNSKAKFTKCNNCSKLETHASDELVYVKEQLIKKTQLLQKAKVLLTRAAAKEKVLKEQLMLWKRKCSELQNVPVIEEISE